MSCLKEHTSILWFGQKIQKITKGKGVKQGCPLSPRLSTIVLDDVLRTLENAFKTKIKMLVRDPINKSIAKQRQEINGVLITPVDTIQYLGTYLTSELSRRDTIKARCKQAIRNTKGLISYIKKTEMHWKIAELIYNTGNLSLHGIQSECSSVNQIK
ncbi:hypothetical protein EVAR_25744_1 [Eumeta japonica]|uniref:Reverse transcriptase domain-containing protein n=1 Tax=Eumeta variegata TaxID=151549 RepID=A0A4C1V857_EUMVA|nr:hypothetical protein EVAR_25744_1 [Eumeta japonica]